MELPTRFSSQGISKPFHVFLLDTKNTVGGGVGGDSGSGLWQKDKQAKRQKETQKNTHEKYKKIQHKKYNKNKTKNNKDNKKRQYIF